MRFSRQQVSMSALIYIDSVFSHIYTFLTDRHKLPTGYMYCSEPQSPIYTLKKSSYDAGRVYG